MTIPGGRAVAATVAKLSLAVAVCVLAAPLAANAQQPAKVPKIGMLSTTPLEHPQARARSRDGEGLDTLVLLFEV